MWGKGVFIEVEGFKEKIKDWWDSFMVACRPDFTLTKKLKF